MTRLYLPFNSFCSHHLLPFTPGISARPAMITKKEYGYITPALNFVGYSLEQTRPWNR